MRNKSNLGGGEVLGIGVGWGGGGGGGVGVQPF